MDYSILIFVVASVFLKNTFEFIHTSIVDIEMYTLKNAFRFMIHNQNTNRSKEYKSNRSEISRRNILRHEGC